MFLIYFNDLQDYLESKVDSFADDTTITTSGKNLQEIEKILTSDCEKVSAWMKGNKLKLNAEKTHIMTIGTRPRLSALTRKLNVVMDGITLQSSNSESFLGCQMDADLKWNNQIELLLAKLSKRLACISRLRYICPFHILKSVVEGIFTSLIVYCLPLFGGLDIGQVNQIQVLQNKAALIVCSAPARAKRLDLFKKVEWLTVQQLIAFHTLLQIFKIRQQKEPKYLAEHLCRDSRNGRIFVPNHNLSVTAKSFCFRGTSLWNSLPRSLRDMEKLSLFKKEARKWVDMNVQRFLD